MRIAVIGTGGVGGYFGARLSEAGEDVTFIARGAHLEAMKNKGLAIDSQIMKGESVDYLVNKKMGDLMHAEQQATTDTFRLNDFKFREIFIDLIDEESIGMLMTNSIIETIAACIYFDVDPFNQPAV